jgi:hypothetical protein
MIKVTFYGDINTVVIIIELGITWMPKLLIFVLLW